MARTAKRYKKNTEKKVLGIPVCMAAIYVRLSVDSDEKKSEPIETQVTLIKEFIQKHNENPNREYEIAVYNIYSDLGKTGTNFDRPGFERMMNDVREGKINCILVKDDCVIIEPTQKDLENQGSVAGSVCFLTRNKEIFNFIT